MVRWCEFQSGDKHIATLAGGMTVAAIREPNGRWKACALGTINNHHTYDTVDGAKIAAIAQAQMIIDEAARGLWQLATETAT